RGEEHAALRAPCGVSLIVAEHPLGVGIVEGFFETGRRRHLWIVIADWWMPRNLAWTQPLPQVAQSELASQAGPEKRVRSTNVEFEQELQRSGLERAQVFGLRVRAQAVVAVVVVQIVIEADADRAPVQQRHAF